jgi:hypothetical protein
MRTFQSGALNLSCLQETTGSLHHLFAGDLGDSPEDQTKIVKVWDCLDRTLDIFSKNTRGANEGYFLASELQDFANLHLKKGQGISDALALSIFQLKTAVLGGDEKKLTQDEILKLRANLRAFGVAIAPLAPHIKVLLSTSEYPDAKNQAAIRALREFAGKLAAIFANSVNPMKWDTLAGFALSLDQFLAVEQKSALNFVYEDKDLLRFTKVLLIGGSEVEIEQSRWKAIAYGITSVFSTLVITRNTNERVEKFEFELTSSPAEQGRALDGLGEALKELIKREGAQSGRIKQIADYWIKARLALEVLLPGYGSKVSLGLLLKDPELRQSENKIIRRWLSAREFKKDPKSLAEILGEFRQHLQITDRVLGRELGDQASFSVKKMITMTQEYRNFFASPEMAGMIPDSLGLFMILRSWITGKSSDEVALSELDPIMAKAEQVLLGIPENSLSLEEKIRKMIEVMRKPPALDKLSRKTLEDLIPRLVPLVNQGTHEEISEETLREVLDALFELKSGLWNSDKSSISLSDIESALDLLKIKDEFKKDPVETLAKVDQNWRRGGFIPGVQLPLLVKISKLKLPNRDPWSKIADLGNGVESLRSSRKFLLGVDQDFLPLSDLVEMLRILKKIQSLVVGEKADEKLEKGNLKAKAILDLLLKGKGSLALNQVELEGMISFFGKVSGKDLSGLKSQIPEFLKLKHQLFGTDEKGIEKHDFEIISALLKTKTKGQGMDLLGEVLEILEKQKVPDSSSINFNDWLAFMEGFKNQNPELLKNENLIQKLKAVQEIKNVLLGENPPEIRISELKAALKNSTHGRAFTPVSEARFLLGLFLSRNPEAEFKLSDLQGRVTRLKEPVQILTGKSFDAEKYSRLIRDILKLKSVLFKSDSEVITREEIEKVDQGLQIVSSDLPKDKKAARLSALIKATVKKPIKITTLVSAIQAIVKDLDLTKKLPIPLTVANVQKIKVVAMGGDPDTVTPTELASLTERITKANSAKDMIEKPAFGLNAQTFLWLESAFGLLVESGKEFSLKETSTAIDKYFTDSGMVMKYPMDQSLFMIWNHLLEGHKGMIRPATVVLTDDQKIKTAHIAAFRDLFKGIRVRLEDLERAFGGAIGTKNRSEVYPKLKEISNQRVLDLFAPVTVEGRKRPSLYLSAEFGQKLNFAYAEVAYRVVMNEVVTYLFTKYNIRGNDPVLNTAEFALLLDDLRIPMMNFGLLYKSGPPAQVATSQMRTINLFARNGNGDGLLQVDETVEFMTLTFGTGASFKSLVTYLGQNCQKKQVDGLDAFDGRCVMRYLFQPALYAYLYGGSLPGMVNAYKTMTAKQRVVFETGTLRLTGKKLFNEKKRGLFDSFSDRTIDDYNYVDFDLDMLQSINFVHPLIEWFFETMDSDHDEKIQLPEALALFPKVCPLLKESAKGKVKGDCSSAEKSKDLKALYGYLLIKKEKPGFDWLIWDGTWEDYLSGENKMTPLTRMDIFTILSNLAP